MTHEQGAALKAGDVVQIDPAHHEHGFGGCLLLVTEPKSWGVMGFVHIPGEAGGEAYYRVGFQHIELIGPAVWPPAPEGTDGK